MPERLGDRLAEFVLCRGLADADRRPSRAGFTNTGRPSSAATASKVGASLKVKVKKRGIGRPRVAHQTLGDILVHRSG